jgi:hypothetical protein
MPAEGDGDAAWEAEQKELAVLSPTQLVEMQRRDPVGFGLWPSLHLCIVLSITG